MRFPFPRVPTEIRMESVLILQAAASQSRIEESVRRAQFQSVTASTFEEAVRSIRNSEIKVVLLDDATVAPSSIELVREFQCHLPSIQVVVLVQTIDTQGVIDLVKEGAFDVVADYNVPDKLHRLMMKASHAAQSFSERESEPAMSDVTLDEPVSIIGTSPEMVEIYKAIGQIARSNATVLIEGETGTGKELVADEIFANSLRADGPYHKLNCAALSETLLESELFGHEKGAFTDAHARKIGKFEICNGGTIFLDEIGDMSSQTQAKVLRLLQEQAFERVGGNETIRVDVRIIAATNKSLLQLSKRNEFRWDLFYRLKVIHLHLPGLRERTGDVMLLARHFLRRHAAMIRKDIRHISPLAESALEQHSWPGNVRELQNAIEAAVVRCKGHTVEVDHLPEGLSDVESDAEPGLPVFGDWTHLFQGVIDRNFERLLRECRGDLHGQLTQALETGLIGRALTETGGNQVHAARLLGISRNTLRDRIERFELAG